MSKETKTLEIALYYTYGDFTTIEPHIVQSWMEENKNFFRISSPIQAIFELIPHEIIVKEQISVLKEERDIVLAEAQNKATEFTRRINELLAIPSPQAEKS